MIPKLYEPLLAQLKTADECWIAVGLINNFGVESIIDNTPNECKRHFIIGINLPTPPKTLELLRRHHVNGVAVVHLFARKSEYFHPKLYLVHSNKQLCAFIGSANCTKGGLKSNIELTHQVDAQAECKQLKRWFTSTAKRCELIINYDIEAYRKRFPQREQAFREEQQAADEAIEALTTTAKHGANRELLIEHLQEFKNGPKYAAAVEERQKTIDDLKNTLDYPRFSRLKIDVDGFFAIPELGRIISIPIPTIKREIGRFSKMLRVLCDDDDSDVAELYKRATTGDLSITGVNKALVTKVLTMHNPQRYFVSNEKSKDALGLYGIRWSDNGKSYKATCSFLEAVCRDAGIKNLAVLDQFLWIKRNSVD